MIRVAMVGVPRAGSFFNAFRSHPETEIVALCDINASRSGRRRTVDGR